jgi:hypothetical protein
MAITFGVKPLGYTAPTNTTIQPYVVGSVSNIATQTPGIISGSDPVNSGGGFMGGFTSILGGLISGANAYANIVNAQNTHSNNTNVGTPPYVEPRTIYVPTATGGTQTNYGTDAPPKKSNTTTIIVIVVGVVILGLGIFFLTRKK